MLLMLAGTALGAVVAQDTLHMRDMRLMENYYVHTGRTRSHIVKPGKCIMPVTFFIEGLTGIRRSSWPGGCIRRTRCRCMG